MAERGRKPGFRMSEEHRVKIQNSNILNALIEHVEGRREMSATQVTAGLGLLRKVLPDLASSTVDHTSSDGSMAPITGFDIRVASAPASDTDAASG